MSKYLGWLLATKHKANESLKTVFTKKEEGASAAEYALLLGLIAVAIVAAVSALSGSISAAINAAAGAI
jgi:Flp pilus assembly pilin Flp